MAVAYGDEATFDARHPGPADLGLVVEVADSSLLTDRQEKSPVYGGAGVPEYWIVNIPHRQIEVYTLPSGPSATPGYGHCQVYVAGTAVPLALAGVTLGTIAVDGVIF